MLTIALVCPEAPSPQVLEQIRSIHEVYRDLARSDVGDYEVVIVATRSLTEELRDEIQQLDNAKGFCLLEGDADAVLVEALRRASGDYVFIADARNPRFDVLRDVLRGSRLSQGVNDVIHFGCAESVQYPFSSRIISRRVVRSVLGSRDPAQAFHALRYRDAFTHVDHDALSRPASFGRGAFHALRMRWRATFSNRVLPLRLVSLLAMFGACANLVYSAYVVLVYLLKDDVMPGWATLSLQQGGMFMVFSLATFVGSEYVVSAIRRERRAVVIEEVRSDRKLFDERNVEAVR